MLWKICEQSLERCTSFVGSRFVLSDSLVGNTEISGFEVHRYQDKCASDRSDRSISGTEVLDTLALTIDSTIQVAPWLHSFSSNSFALYNIILYSNIKD